MLVKLRRALTVTFVLQAAAMAGAVAFQVLSARWLGPAGRGQLAMLVSASQITAMLIGLGLPGAISYYAASMPESIPVLARRELKLLAFLALLLGAALVVNRLLTFYDLVIGVEVWFALYTLGSVAQPAFASLTLATGAVVTSNLTTLTAAAGSALALGALAAFGLTGLSVAFGSLAVATLVGAALGVLRVGAGGLATSGSHDPGWSEQLTVAGLGFVSNILALLMFRADVFLVAALGGGDRAAGLYSIGVLAAELLVRVPNWTASVLAPVVSAQPKAAQRVTVSLFWVSVLFVALATTPILLLPDTARWLLAVAVGQEFAESYPVLVAMVPRIVAQAGGAILFGNLAGRGYSLYHPLACGVGLALMVAVDLVLIPRFGVVGAAAGSGIGYLGATIVAFRGFLALNEIDLGDFKDVTLAEVSNWRRAIRERMVRG